MRHAADNSNFTYTINGVAGQVGGWYLSVSSVNNTIYTTLSVNTTYNTVNFTPTTFLKRIPDPRNLADRTYRVRYVIDKDKTNLILHFLYQM